LEKLTYQEEEISATLKKFYPNIDSDRAQLIKSLRINL